MRTAWLKIRMGLSVVLLFAVIYALLSVIVFFTVGMGTLMVYALAFFAFVLVSVQFFIGPKIVERSMRVRYVSEQEQPELHRMVSELAMKAGIPKPRVGISEMPIPNAFAFGTSKKKARVCVTRRLMEMLKRDELEAVLGHELSHIRHQDMVVITALSVIPMICYFIYFSFFWSGLFGGMGGRSREGALPMMAIALIALVVYFISNLIVLYVSRVREYYADAGSAELTRKPHGLASALYKMIYGSVGAKQEKVKKEMGSMRAFFAADPITARTDLKDLLAADLNKDGKIDEYELRAFAERARVSRADRLMEIFSTHPTPVSRVKKLGEYL